MPDPVAKTEMLQGPDPSVAPVPAALMAAVESAMVDPAVAGGGAAPAPGTGPDVTADPPTHGQDPSDTPPDPGPGAPSSTTPPVETPVPPDSEPKKPEDGAAADTPAGDTPPDPAAVTRPSDEFGSLPESTPPKTRERFETMKSKYDEVVQAREHAEEVATRWFDAVRQTGATEEQYGKTLGFLADVNSGDPVRLRAAYDALNGQLVEIAKVLKIPAAGYDPLSEHPDLLERVNDEDDPLPRDVALELAEARGRKHIEQVRATSRQQATVQQQQFQQESEAAIGAVSALGAQLRAANPTKFAAALPQLSPIIDQVVASMPPSTWVETIRKAYEAIPAPAAAPAAARPPAPIRPSGAGPASGLTKTPGSALEAVNAALGL